MCPENRSQAENPGVDTGGSHLWPVFGDHQGVNCLPYRFHFGLLCGDNPKRPTGCRDDSQHRFDPRMRPKMNANRLCRCACFLTMVSTALTAQVRRTPDAVVLQHWPAPLYWQPLAAAPGSLPSAPLLVLVAITPCRLLDTRAGQGFPSPFGAPSLAAGASRTFPLQSSTTCSVPPAAQAYSLNITGGSLDARRLPHRLSHGTTSSSRRDFGVVRRFPQW